MEYYINRYDIEGIASAESYYTESSKAGFYACDHEDEDGNMLTYVSTDLQVDGKIIEQNVFSGE